MASKSSKKAKPARAAKSRPAARKTATAPRKKAPKPAASRKPVAKAKAAPARKAAPAAKKPAPKPAPKPAASASAPKPAPAASSDAPVLAGATAVALAPAPAAALVPAPTVEILPAPILLSEPGAAPASEAKGAGAVAEKILAGTHDESVGSFGAALLGDREAAATQAARVIDELLARKPAVLVPLVDRFVTAIASKNPRVVQTAANALPALGRLAPARVARNLDALTGAFTNASAMGKDGLVRTFASLCAASVAYQKRLEPVLDMALSGADPKELARWTEIVLPALKGEPHARARAVVEARVNDIPKPIAQRIAAFLGIKLRPPQR